MDPATLGRFGAVCPTDLARRSETAGRTRGGHLHNLWAIRSRFDVPLDIGRFTALNVRSPQLRLIEAMPPLKPAAEAVVRAMIRAYGNELFGRGNANSGLRALIKARPVPRSIKVATVSLQRSQLQPQCRPYAPDGGCSPMSCAVSTIAAGGRRQLQLRF
jgi:hypothetical protein